MVRPKALQPLLPALAATALAAAAALGLFARLQLRRTLHQALATAAAADRRRLHRGGRGPGVGL
jgi:hypothetical protein